MIKEVVVCGSEIWPVTQMDMKTLNTWDRNILRRICGQKVEEEIWRIRTNQEMWELYENVYIVAGMKIK